MNFYRRYIADLSLIVKPLTKLSQKGNKFTITEEVREAVRNKKDFILLGIIAEEWGGSVPTPVDSYTQRNLTIAS
jgi:hypothetical protein